MTIRMAIASRRIAGIVALCLAAAPAVRAVDLPSRKAGHWEITTTSDNPKISPHVEDICLDSATDALMSRFAMGATQKMCSAIDIGEAGGGNYSIDTSCTLGSRRMSIHGEVMFAGNSAYRETVHTKYDPPLMGRSESTSVHEAKWTGACAADMRPGDVVSRPTPMMPAGMRINIIDAMRNGQ